MARPLKSFAYGARFEGAIESELREVPSNPVRISLFGWSDMDGGGKTFTLKFDAAPSAIEKSEAGIVIPFRFNVPDTPAARSSRDVRLVVRTSTWPLGWGTTFNVG